MRRTSLLSLGTAAPLACLFVLVAAVADALASTDALGVSRGSTLMDQVAPMTGMPSWGFLAMAAWLCVAAAVALARAYWEDDRTE